MIGFQHLHRNAIGLLGYIPSFLSLDDPRPAKEQLHENYIGGWHPFEGFSMEKETGMISYPGDPVFYPIAKATLRNETIYVYPYAWVAIVQPDHSFEIARMD